MRGMAKSAVSSVHCSQISDSVSYLSQQEAASIDEILMGPLGFSVDQLMVRDSLLLFDALFLNLQLFLVQND